YTTGVADDRVNSSPGDAGDVPCGTTGGAGLGGNDTLPQNLTVAIPTTSAMPATPTPIRNCASVIDTDFTIHAARAARYAQSLQPGKPLTDSTVSEPNRMHSMVMARRQRRSHAIGCRVVALMFAAVTALAMFARTSPVFAEDRVAALTRMLGSASEK